MEQRALLSSFPPSVHAKSHPSAFAASYIAQLLHPHFLKRGPKEEELPTAIHLTTTLSFQNFNYYCRLDFLQYHWYPPVCVNEPTSDQLLRTHLCIRTQDPPPDHHVVSNASDKTCNIELECSVSVRCFGNPLEFLTKESCQLQNKIK